MCARTRNFGIASKLQEIVAICNASNSIHSYCLHTMGACMNKKFLLDEASSAWASAFIFIHNISWLNHVDHTRQQEAVVLGGLWLRRPGKVIQGSELRVLVRKIFTGDSMPATPWFPIQQWNNLLTVGGCSSATS